MSDLNEDLFQRHLSDDRSCPCGNVREDVTHYLTQCPLFAHARTTTILVSHSHHSVQDMLLGCPTLTVPENEVLFQTVQSFIRVSGRFHIQV